MTTLNFPDEVLLEIFDSYRQSFGDQFSSERVWNNKNGWFKLAHVCHNWRSIVLASPSRLRLRLYFAHNTPTRRVALECFTYLKTIVDYTDSTWKASATKRFATALRYPDRVCGIAVRRSEKSSDNLKISKALDLPLPALESLVVDNTGVLQRVVLPTSLTTSIQSLRHLRLVNANLTSLLPLLPATRTLVDLNLTIETIFDTTSKSSLLTYLQHMPHLRNLQVTMHLYSQGPTVEMPPTTIVLLAELSSIRLFGSNSQTERFLAGLVTPSLRELHISAIDRDYGFSNKFDIPCLSKFIRAAGMCFVAARLVLSSPIRIALFAPPYSMDDPPSQVVTIDTLLTANKGSAFSTMLAILEDIFFSPANTWLYRFSFGNLAPWRKFFEHFCNVKVLRLHHGLEKEVSSMLLQSSVNPPPPREDVDPDTTTPSGTPINSSRSQCIFPSLEEIVVYPRTPRTFITAKERAFVLESFGLFKAARDQMGRPVKVSWNTDREIPVCSLK